MYSNLKKILGEKNLTTRAAAAVVGISASTFDKKLKYGTFDVSEAFAIVDDLLPEYDVRFLFAKKGERYKRYTAFNKEKGKETMYYATFKNIGKTDIAVFKEKNKRDEWVNFKDQISVAVGVTKDNCTFEREALETEKASKMLLDKPQKYLPLEQDEYNPDLYWHRMKNS